MIAHSLRLPRSRLIISCSFSLVAATKRRLTALLLVPRDFSPGGAGSIERTYFRVETPSTICSTARGVSGSASANCSHVSSFTSSPSTLRTRGRRTLTRRPPNASSPSVWPALVALGIDEDAEKHVLGLYEGATENTTSCAGLLSDLEARGVRTDRAMLFVIDGSKALAKAIRAKFGTRALIQRCQVHKKRNVEDHLPEDMKRNAGRTMSAAYQSGNAVRAKRMLEGLARQLERKHPSAAASLREGLDETLTVMRFSLDVHLARTLSTTNPIEFINGRIRKTTKNVARWDGGEMVLRWLAVALIEASKTFRKLRGHKGMPKLVAALRAHDAKLTPTVVDVKEKAA